METTTNYKLPQWVKADQIKMDDFNGAFANIDAALKANADAAASKASSAELNAVRQEVAAAREANCLVKLAGPLVTTTDNAAMEFDLSQVDMTKVAALMITFSATSSNGSMNIAVNDTTLGTACSNSWSSTAGLLWLMPMNGEVSFVSTLTTSKSNSTTAGYGGNKSISWNAVSKISLTGTSDAGASATLFAVRK